MANLIRREIVNQPVLPSGSYFYKKKNGKDLWKNRYTTSWYMVYPIDGGKFAVEEYTGQCSC